MSKRYIHHFEQTDGSVLSILSHDEEPSEQLLAAMAASECDWIHTTHNPDI